MTRTPKTSRKPIELDVELIADLEAGADDANGVKGGGFSRQGRAGSEAEPLTVTC